MGFSITLEIPTLKKLFDLLKTQVSEVYGPILKQGAISLGQIDHFEQLPNGWQDRQSGGTYALEKVCDPTLFGYAVGPHSIKNVLHPSKRKLWDAQRQQTGSISFTPVEQFDKKLAFFGIRSCDVEAIQILDQVFLNGTFKETHYENLRKHIFLVTASCRNPSAVCFCTSMGHGPKPRQFDINLTEIYHEYQHYFVAESGSIQGTKLLKTLQGRFTNEAELKAANDAYKQACQKINKKLNTQNLPQLLQGQLAHPHWEEVAHRCLSCGNCTMVCPTCFCTSTMDKTDLEGDHTERWLQWDSCFTRDFSYIHGGEVRSTTQSRYRQWLTHKLSHWQDQFGSLGCVGCGRCIAWCPVKIDLTEEVAKLINDKG